MVWDRKEADIAWRNKNRDKVRAAQARWREKHLDHIRAHGKEYRKAYPLKTRSVHLRVAYGLNLAQYAVMLEAQKDRCAICNKTTEQNGKRLSVDHCHKTKRIRGLLCYKCNTGIACFGDNLPLIASAMAYLQARATREETK